MNPTRSSISTLAIGAVSVALLGAVAGIGFALWSQHGPRMFMAMIENGLAWCF